ncbi:MAG: AbrB/MazE/SpoVT family DNA-binding domain-containing protein [Anaerolineales bacterium]|nr:AbrB/MazE/SpoVT family DNA-binding domain-containing protein [Anaerolineales bacterium]
MNISVKVSAKYQIAVPQMARKQLNIKKGDRLIVDVQDGVIVLIPQPKRHTDALQGLHSEIWRGVDVQKYLNRERDSWTNSANA